MFVNSDFTDLLKIFSDNVKYLVINTLSLVIQKTLIFGLVRIP